MGKYWVIRGGTGLYLVVLGQYGALLVGTLWIWDSMGRYWLVFGGTGSKWGSTGSLWGGIGQYLVVLGQNMAVLVTLGQYGAVLAGTW